jgi:hypothetical protein
MKDKSGKTINDAQPMATATRPQTIKDTLGNGTNSWTSGVAPKGGYHSTWDFSGRTGDYKNSPVTKPEKGTI